MIPYDEIDRRLALINKDRVWLASQTPYRPNTIRQALSPKGNARSPRIQEVLSRAIEDEEKRLSEAMQAQNKPGIYEIFLTSEQLDRADRASRLAQSSSLVSFCREAILARANEILSTQVEKDEGSKS